MCKSSVSNGIGGKTEFSNRGKELDGDGYGLASIEFHPSSTIVSIMTILVILAILYCLCGAVKRSGLLRRVDMGDHNNAAAINHNAANAPFVPRL